MLGDECPSTHTRFLPDSHLTSRARSLHPPSGPQATRRWDTLTTTRPAPSLIETASGSATRTDVNVKQTTGEARRYPDGDISSARRRARLTRSTPLDGPAPRQRFNSGRQTAARDRFPKVGKTHGAANPGANALRAPHGSDSAIHLGPVIQIDSGSKATLSETDASGGTDHTNGTDLLGRTFDTR